MEAGGSCPLESEDVAGGEASEASRGMKRNDDKLKEMMALASACLRSKRLPGEIRERDLFERWDAEVAAIDAAREAEGTSSPTSGAPLPQAPALVPPTPEGLSTEQRLAKLRRDVQRVERLTGKKRQELEDTNAALYKAVLDRCKVQDELRTLQDEAQKHRRSIRKARDMVRRQECETQQLRQAIKDGVDPKETRAPAPPVPPPGSAPKSARARAANEASGTEPPQALPRVPPGATLAAADSAPELQEAVDADGTSYAEVPVPSTDTDVAGAKHENCPEDALLGASEPLDVSTSDEKGDVPEGHRRSENEHSRRVHGGRPEPEAAAVGDGGSRKPRQQPGQQDPRVLASKPPSRGPGPGVTVKGPRHLGPNDKAFTSVLKGKPKRRSMYIA